MLEQYVPTAKTKYFLTAERLQKATNNCARQLTCMSSSTLDARWAVLCRRKSSILNPVAHHLQTKFIGI
ncbi:unnamed protein product [Ixodes persulcatus]